MPNGGVRFPHSAGGSYQLPVPEYFHVPVALMLKDAMGSSFQGAKGIARKLHVTWDHTSAHQLARTPVGAERADARLSGPADEVVEQYEVCHGLDKAPQPPVAGASSVPSFNEEL